MQGNISLWYLLILYMYFDEIDEITFCFWGQDDLAGSIIYSFVMPYKAPQSSKVFTRLFFKNILINDYKCLQSFLICRLSPKFRKVVILTSYWSDYSQNGKYFNFSNNPRLFSCFVWENKRKIIGYWRQVKPKIFW